MNPKRIVMTALPGRNWVTTGMKCFMNSFREAASTRASTRLRTPTPYTSAPIQAMPNQMWRNRRTNAMTSATRRHRPILLKSFADAGRSLISRERIRGSMSDLVEAIEAEARGDFSQALTHYEKLTASGSAIDRVGILQALAAHAPTHDDEQIRENGVHRVHPVATLPEDERCGDAHRDPDDPSPQAR